MKITRSLIMTVGVALLGVSLSAQAWVKEQDTIDPVWGDLFTRQTLAENWGGVRNDAKAKGFTLDATLTQVVQGVVTGGKDHSWEYGGRANVTANLDTQKMGLWPGGFATVEFESNWANSVNGNAGSLGVPNANQLFPVPAGDHVALPQLSFAQFVSPYAGAIIGKLDTMSGDMNEFAHGKGDTQFLNLSLSINPVALVVPYSTLGGGVIVLPTKDPNAAVVNFLVVQATGKATQSGFDDISSDNLIFTGEGRVRTNFFGLTGHQLVGALYSNARYTSIDQRLGFVVDNRALVPKRDTWAVYYNFDHFLYETDKSAGRGVGVFGRFGASEGNPNPVQYFGSLGVGSKGLLRERPNDRFGVGFYYAAVENPMLQLPFTTKSFLGDEWGLEAFYNLAITPWMQLTPDIQVIGPSQNERVINFRSRENIDTAVVLGTRLQLVF